MQPHLPAYFFRVRDNGALVFRVDTENRQQRIEMDPIAVINIRNGDHKAHGDRQLTDADEQAIANWIETRQETLRLREIDDINRTVEHLNQMAHWANSKADPDVLDAVTDDILMAMHDLRQVLVHKRTSKNSAT